MASLPVVSDTQYLTYLRERLEGDFKSFVRYFFKSRKNTKFVFNWHHDLICDELMAIYYGVNKHVIFNLPPRYSKTELIIILFSAWCYVRNPRCEEIHLSYSEPLALENSDAIRAIIKSFEFRQLWPHITIAPHKDAKNAWTTVQGGVFKATMTGGGITGFGAGRMDEYDEATGVFTYSGAIKIDDPLKPDDARHETLREGANRRWDETIKSRRNSPHTPVIVVMQRIHGKDFTAQLLADSEFKWHHVNLEALIDEGLPTERALWEAKHSVDQLKAMRDKVNDRGEPNPVAQESFSAQYQQRPSPMGGGILKKDWWRMHDAPLLDVIAECTAFLFTADTAYTENTANDASSIGFYGMSGARRITRLDELNGRWEFPDLLLNFVRFYLRHQIEGLAPMILIEAKASGLSLVQTLQRGVRIDKHEIITHHSGRIIELTPGQIVKLPAKAWAPKQYGYPDDKVGRAKEASWQLHAGACWIMSDDINSPAYAPWVKPFKDECGQFTANDTHEADDRVDDFTMAVSYFTKYGGGRNE